MVSRTNEVRHALNTAAQQIRRRDGELGQTTAPLGAGVHVRVGDQVMAKRPGRHEHPRGDLGSYVRNGSRGVVIDVNPGDERPVTVEFEGLGQIAPSSSWLYDPTEHQGLDLAYALTSYAVQGATLPRSTSGITARARLGQLIAGMATTATPTRDSGRNLG